MYVLNDANIVKAYIDAGADVNAKDIDGGTALMCVVALGRLNVVKELIKAGADVNAKNNEGETALMHVAEFKYPIGIVDAFIKANNTNNRTALRRANESRRLDIAKELIQAGADVNAKDNNGKSALDYAKEEKHTDIVNLLQEAMDKQNSN